MNTPIIDIRGLTKRYEGKRATSKLALDAVDLVIPKGSFFGLLGPNGAGKSTLINILAGLVNKTSGTVKINGVDIDKDPRAARYEIGVVPQEVIIDPFFSVRETLEYYAGYYGVPKDQRRTQEILDALHLADKSHLNSRRLSGGMKRRMLIAKALVHNPPVLVLDEPTAGVDVDLRLQLWDYVRKLNKQGTTVLLTTHYLEEAQELCDQIAIINHGKIIANDSTKKLMRLLDQKALMVHVEEEISEVPASLSGYDATLNDAHSLCIQYRRADTSINQLLDAVKKAKLTISDLSTQEPDLEDIFRHLVKA